MLSITAALALGCEESRPLPPSVDSCRAGWQPFTSLLPAPQPRELALAGDEIIYSAETAAVGGEFRLEALPLAGGPPRRIAGPVVVSNLWIEGDQVVFAWGPELASVPLAGGTPTLLVDALPERPSAQVFAHALTPTDFLWTLIVPDATEVWSVPRAGGAKRMLTTLPDTAFYQYLVLGDGVGIAAGEGGGVAFPLGGGDARPLSDAGFHFAGVDATGVYGYDLKGASNPGQQQYQMHFAPVDGGAARPFWPDLPPRAIPGHLWPDGRGGWVVAARETFDDELDHLSIFVLDAQGHGRRAACNPNADDHDFATTAPVVTDDAITFAIWLSSAPIDDYWRFVKVPRR